MTRDTEEFVLGVVFWLAVVAALLLMPGCQVITEGRFDDMEDGLAKSKELSETNAARMIGFEKSLRELQGRPVFDPVSHDADEKNAREAQESRDRAQDAALAKLANEVEQEKADDDRLLDQVDRAYSKANAHVVKSADRMVADTTARLDKQDTVLDKLESEREADHRALGEDIDDVRKTQVNVLERLSSYDTMIESAKEAGGNITQEEFDDERTEFEKAVDQAAANAVRSSNTTTIILFVLLVLALAGKPVVRWGLNRWFPPKE